MLFEVYKDGRRLMWTIDEECIPPKKTIESMKKCGHKILLDGKTFKANSSKKKE